MSIYSITQYYSEVEKIIHFGGTKKETAIRNAFYNLLNEYAKSKGLILVPEVTIRTAAGKNVTPDGTLKDSLRQDWGYWESKDEADEINEEIKKKFDKGYPKENILFEDSKTAVLIQNGVEVMRVPVSDSQALDRLLLTFISFERPEVKNFRKAIELFKQDIPKVTETIREMLEIQEKTNPKFVKERDKFLQLCHDSINPDVTKADVREMIIQHILTEDIFNTIFDETQFHRENNIAHQLEGVINTFFTGSTKRTALSTLQHYSQTINAAAAGIADHHEKQKFLKVVYETFYKSYNPKAADRLGVVYTPNEIVKFMIESTDYLLNKHFGKFLEDKGVEILDPATGTGTFVCDIIDYIRKEKLEYKYKNEIHANEVAILPYYISNLNIEFTYKQKMGAYAEFENLCFVDTLDNMGFTYRGKQVDMFAPFTEENSKRIKRQNDKKISVVIGNPPYNANQVNENEKNKNREYPIIDKRIKDTFIMYSTAQKTKVYDMYARFYRWSFDRLNDKGIISFITNNSFINSKTFDGFRKCVQDEFQYVYIIDLGGNIRELSGKDGIYLNEKHTIFGQAAAVGIAIMFLIKDKIESQKVNKCQINYIHPTDIRATRDEKINFLNEHKFKDISFEHVTPDKNNNWINLTDNDFETLLPLRNEKNPSEQLFFSNLNGVATSRDEWVYDFSAELLTKKAKFFISHYNKLVDGGSKEIDKIIKWSSTLISNYKKGKKAKFNESYIVDSIYRPFIKQKYYSEKILNDRLTENHYEVFGKKLDKDNVLLILAAYDRKPFTVFSVTSIQNMNFFGDPAQSIPLYRYDIDGNRKDNITNFGLAQFVKQYKKSDITKKDIFQYIYALLHNPVYRKKYELNLKRELPRISFYKNFAKWSDWGKALMDLHINYETVKPFALKETNIKDIKEPKAKLKADKETGVIILDEATTLSGVPAEAWEYKLGNRSALEWVLDQYKEKKPSDPTIAEKFNTYKFADYKPQVIDLLKRVCTVSVETMKIIKAMEAEKE